MPFVLFVTISDGVDEGGVAHVEVEFSVHRRSLYVGSDDGVDLSITTTYNRQQKPSILRFYIHKYLNLTYILPTST